MISDSHKVIFEKLDSELIKSNNRLKSLGKQKEKINKILNNNSLFKSILNYLNEKNPTLKLEINGASLVFNKNDIDYPIFFNFAIISLQEKINELEQLL